MKNSAVSAVSKKDDVPAAIVATTAATTVAAGKDKAEANPTAAADDPCSSIGSKSGSNLRKRKKSLRDVYFDERSRAKSTVPSAEPVSEDSLSVDSRDNNVKNDVDKEDQRRTWTVPYIPQPTIASTTVASVGIAVFIMAMTWPPILLLLFAVASVIVPYCFRENDFASNRRKLYQQFLDDSNGEHLPKSFRHIVDCLKIQHHSGGSSSSLRDDYPFWYSAAAGPDPSATANIVVQENFWRNARGMQLHTVIMTPPKHQTITAVVCFCHGYTDNVSYTKLAEYQRLVELAGMAFVGIEYEGHGLSDGLLGYIGDWNLVIDDVTSYFTHILRTVDRFRHRPAFLMGESMGGAIAYDVYNRIPHQFKGVVLVSPMCKISDDMLPAPIVIDCLKRLLESCPWLGYLPIAPSKASLEDVVYKVVSKRIEAHLSPLNYGRCPRLATARELIDSTQRISESLYEFDAPLLIVHGMDDVVTDPSLSQQLHDECQSTDKTIRLYETMWHSLLGGEPDDNVDRVFNDIVQWITERSL